jgi:hypothetical protein
MPDDDDLRFGDVSGEGTNNRENRNIAERTLELLVSAFIILVMGYMLLKTVEILFEVSIPFV